MTDDEAPLTSVEPARDVVVGDVVEVTLADLPGAGYRWEPVGLPAGLTALDSDWLQVRPPAGVGASRARVLRLRADRAGDYLLRLELRRPWEDAPARATEVPVTVRPAP